MRTIISTGDFIDIFHKLSLNGPEFFLKRFKFSETSRVKTVWDKNTKPPVHWWSIPRIRRRWNKIITGTSEMDFPEYTVNKYLKGKRDLKLISPGCGTGSIELKFAKYDNFSRIEGFDLSPGRIRIAKKNARKSGLSNIFYFVEDVNKYNFGVKQYDVILFNSSLHHFNNIEIILEKICKALKSDGLLIINEYVGPNRFQWTNTQLKEANRYLKKIPSRYRKLWKSNCIKKKIYRPGLLRMILSDSSEAVHSEEILPLIRTKFERIEEKPYGGNLLHLIFKDISHNFTEDKRETNKILDFLSHAEDNLLKKTNKSDFIFGVYTRK